VSDFILLVRSSCGIGLGRTLKSSSFFGQPSLFFFLDYAFFAYRVNVEFSFSGPLPRVGDEDCTFPPHGFTGDGHKILFFLVLTLVLLSLNFFFFSSCIQNVLPLVLACTTWSWTCFPFLFFSPIEGSIPTPFFASIPFLFFANAI